LTGEALRDRLGITDLPILSAGEAGRRLARLGQAGDFSLFEYWLTDYAGHGQDMDTAVALLETFDAVLGGLLDGWDDAGGLILLTSDHGNLEDLTTRRHTLNPVPALIVGAQEPRRILADSLHSLADVQPGVLHALGLSR
jgi:bisphosphoglycerate-independent phosphoglycerate mutase (AlkP superfamily)